MDPAPKLIDVHVPADPQGVVLVLHGGASRKASAAVSPTQLSVLRMIPIARRIVAAADGRLAVFRLLNSVRGWDTSRTPLADAQWALDEIGRKLGRRRPTCLVGHSLGGRAALMCAGAPDVVSAVALAPWVYPTDRPQGLSGQRILIVHGSSDRVADPDRSAAVARAIGARARLSYVEVAGGDHALLRRRLVFETLTADFAVRTLLGRGDSRLMARIEAGEPLITV